MPLPSLLLLPVEANGEINFTIIDVNTCYLKITGMAEDNLIDKEILEVFPAEPENGISFLQQSLMEVAATGQPHKIITQKYHLPVRGTDTSEVRYWNIEHVPVTDENGNVVLIIHSVTDVTQIIIEQKVLGDAREELSKILDSSLDIICAVDANGNFLKVSAAAKTVWGYEPEELKGKPMMDYVYPADREKTRTAAANIMAGVTFTNFNNRYVRKDGSVVPINWSASWDANDKIRYGVARDATEKISDDAKYRSLFDNSIDGVLLTYKNGGIIAANNAACAIFGMTEDEICQAGTEALIDREDPRFFLLMQKCDKTGKAVGELTLIRKNGEKFPGDISFSVFIGSHGKQKCSMLIRDITERKKAENAMQHLNSRLQLATESAGMGIWDWNLETGYIEWDDMMYSIYKIDRMQFNAAVADGWLSRLHPADRPRVDEELELAVAGTKKYDTEYRIVLEDASVRHIKAVGVVERAVDGTALRMIGVNWDITQQKEEEQHLKLLQSVVLNTKDAIIITEAEPVNMPGPRIVYVNEAFTKMTGYTAAEVIGKTPRILQGTETDKNELKRLSEALKNWQPCEITIINYKKNGEEFWINISVTPVADEKGWFTHWIAVERDVTEAKLIEIKLSELNENIQKHAKELAISNKELEQFAHIASHDLQEPLRMITSFLTLLEHKYSNVLDEKAKTYIHFAVDGAIRMKQIMIDILAYSRIGRTDNETETIDLDALLKKDMFLFANSMQETGAVIEWQGLPVIKAARVAIQQLFMNLISNGLKYQPVGNKPVITISGEEKEDFWQFAIADNGIGIEERFFEKVFTIFQRLHHKEEYPGTGIGLAICKKIVVSHKGNIWITSKPGAGTTFHFTISKQLS